MKRQSLAAVALIGLFGGSATAADLAVRAPVYRAPPPVVTYFTWTSCYVGGNVGGLWARKQWTDRITGDPLNGQSFGSHDVNSWLGGVQGGCNYQVGAWVFGIQGDYDWTNANGSNANILFLGFTDRSEIRTLGSVTGRIGYAWDRFLGYVKGGGAWERDKYNMLSAGGFSFATASETRGGWTVGIGAEYAFTDLVTGFVEYDYYNFGTRTNAFTCVIPGCGFGGASSFTTDIEEKKSVVKVGFNVRFGSSSPILARY